MIPPRASAFDERSDRPATDARGSPGDGRLNASVSAAPPPTNRLPIKVRVFVDFMIDRMRDSPWSRA